MFGNLKILRYLFAALLLGGSSIALLSAGEKIKVADLPAAVVKAIEAKFPGAELLSAEKELDDGKLEYEVKIKHAGKKYEVEVTADGVIKEVEREDD